MVFLCLTSVDIWMVKMGLIKLVQLPIVISVVFLAVNILTASRSPTIWQDEVMFLDPAANLASGKGFRTTFWSFQDPQKTFTANVPLYPLILAGWIKLGVMEPGWVRSLNFFLMLGIVWMLGEILRPFVAQNKKTGSGLGLFYFLALGWGSIAFSYRSGRYDILCGLLLTTIIYGVLRKSRAGTWAASVAAFLCLWAGLQNGIVLAVEILAALVVWRREAVKPILLVGVSAGIGSICLLFWMWSVEGLENFLKSVRLLGGAKPASLMEFIRGTVRWDLAVLLMICGGFWTAQKHHWKAGQKWALLMGIAVPITFGLLGKYPVYYSLFSILPLLFFFCSLEKRGWHGVIAWVLLVLVIGTGLPARAGLALFEWKERSPENLHDGLAELIKPGANVLADYPFYYVLRKAGASIYGPSFLESEIPQNLQTLVTYPGNPIDQWAQVNSWSLVAEKLPDANKPRILGTARLYAWKVYQRPKN